MLAEILLSDGHSVERLLIDFVYLVVSKIGIGVGEGKDHKKSITDKSVTPKVHIDVIYHEMSCFFLFFSFLRKFILMGKFQQETQENKSYPT